MNNYKKLAEMALKSATHFKLLNEAFVYPDGIAEKMHPSLEKDIKEQKTSLGKHPIFPESDETLFEEKILVNRFADVVKRYKRVFEVSSIDNNEVMKTSRKLLFKAMEIEREHMPELEKLAVEMIRAEYDMDEDTVEINAVLNPRLSSEKLTTQITPSKGTSIEFDSHSEIVEANQEVYKRRFINALIQGAAKKCNQMFHMVEDELTGFDPALPNTYSRLMASADYMYFILPSLGSIDNSGPVRKDIVGGVCEVEFPSKENSKAVINAEAMTFPVLIHELVKGVMELLGAHGLPKDKKIAKYVLSKADYVAAEPWDMRLGPPLWEKFTGLIDPDDFHLKHHIFADIVSHPVSEFNVEMKEIMAGTKAGKKIVADIVSGVKSELHEDEFNEAMGGVSEDDDSDDSGFGWDEIGPFI